MSTIPKEIQEEADKFIHLNDFGKQIWMDGAKFGYQLATDGREELEKENQQLQEDYDIQNYKYTEAVVSITTLQSSLKEKEKECEELKESFLCPHCGQLINHP